MPKPMRLLARSGDWYRPHPWLSVFLPMDAAERYVADALDGLTPATAGPIPMLLYPLRRGSVPAPGLATPPGDDNGLFCTFSILRTVSDDRDAINAALDDNQRLASAATEVGGTVYPISAVRSPAGQVTGTRRAMNGMCPPDNRQGNADPRR
jgi:cytokinin dehydrogenase